jgi:uncharacterized protein YndB with AHSA1/START domain
MSDTNTLVVKQEFVASSEALFAAFTEADKLSAWWDGPSSLDLRIGGKFSFAKKFSNGEICHAQGEVLAFEPASRLVLSWGWEDSPGEFSNCEITFGASCGDGLSAVKIVHDLSKVRNACESGWSSSLMSLYKLPDIKEAKFDWSQFTKSVEIKAPLEDVMSYWTSPEKITTWFLSKAQYFDADKKPLSEAREGCSYRWEWEEGDSVEGEIFALSKEQFSFTFGTPSVINGPDLPPVRVDVKLESVRPGVTRMKLRQYEMPTTPTAMAVWHVSCTTGWTYFYMNLKAVIQHGVDLRN